jgi:multidrug transporter EmrE-like cation transporter
MKPASYVFIVVCAILTVLANLLMRYGLLKSGGLALNRGDWLAGWGATLIQPTFLTGVLLYGLAAVVWFYALSITEVSTGYPLLVGLTFALVTVGAIVLFKESLNPLKIVGIFIILAGIVILARASQRG